VSESEKPTLLVVDGHSLAFRAFYALPVDSFQTRDGQHTNAIHGFISMLISLLKNENPSHIAVAFNVSRSALLVAALTQSPELLLAATEDRLHQSYRAAAMPETNTLITLLREHGFAAVVSGAGPSILVLADDPGRRLEATALVAEHATTPWQSLMLAVDFKGATVGGHPAHPASSA